MTTIHELKTWPEYFQAIMEGHKPFEYRLNDRTPPYAVGDTLHLREWVPPPQEEVDHAEASGVVEEFMELYNGYTGRDVWKTVTYVLPAADLGPQGKAVHATHVIMGLGKMQVGADTNPMPWAPMSDPRDIKIIGKALEEMGEAVSAMARALIQGIDATEPSTGKPNRLWVQEEIADVTATTTLVADRFKLATSAMFERIDRKRDHLTKWFDMMPSS